MPTLLTHIISRRNILVFLVLLTGWSLFTPAPVAAQSIDFSTPIPLQGYAWSKYYDSNGNRVGVGWISMSCETTGDCGASNYGVVAQEDTGDLVGYAWSSNIGWIKFGGLSGFPNGGGSQAQNAELLPNGQMRGWARACSATVGGDCSDMATDPNADGWDGWISLRGNGGGAGGYGVRFATTPGPDGAHPIYSGPGARPGDSFAWGGSTVMGWVDFSQVTLGGTPPTGGDFITATDCVIPVGGSTCDSSLTWNLSTPHTATYPLVVVRPVTNPAFGDAQAYASIPMPGTELNIVSYPTPAGAESGTAAVTLSLDGGQWNPSSGTPADGITSYAAVLNWQIGGSYTDWDEINIRCATGSDWNTSSETCEVPDPDKPDLIVEDLNSNTGSYNEVTGEYSNVDFLFRIRNIGATTTAYEGESSVEWDMEYSESVWPTADTLDGSTPAIDDGASRQVTADAGTLMFGIYTFSAEADRPDDIDEEVEGNNTGGPATVTLYPQDPSMVLTTVSSQIVRSGERAEIRWDTVAEYPMDCTISGPGLTTQTFDPSTAGTSGSELTSERYNTSIYTMTCDVDYPGIDRTFNASTRVEVIPRLEEI